MQVTYRTVAISVKMKGRSKSKSLENISFFFKYKHAAPRENMDLIFEPI